MLALSGDNKYNSAFYRKSDRKRRISLSAQAGVVGPDPERLVPDCD